MKLLGIILLWLLQFCFCKGFTDVPDITAIYHVGRNSNVDYVDIHLRTDALGYAVSVEDNLVGPRDLEFHLDYQNLNTWEHENFTTVVSLSYLYSSVLHKAKGLSGFHQFHEGVQIRIKHSEAIMYGLFLTPDKTPLDLQQDYYYFIGTGIQDYRRIEIYRCSLSQYRKNFGLGADSYPCSHSSYIYKNHYSNTWGITQENGMLKLWLYSSSSSPSASWKFQTRIKFYKFFSREDVSVQIDPFVQVLETKSRVAKLITPSFTPKHKNLCVTAQFYTNTTEATELPPVMIYAQDMLGDKVYLTSFFFRKSLYKDHLYTERRIIPWPRDIVSSKVRLLFQMFVVRGSINLERIASCNADYGEDVILLQNKEIVPFSDIYVPIGKEVNNHAVVEDLHDNGDSIPSVPHIFDCWHNSISTQTQCVCPPGFSGPECKKGCGRNRYGKDCEGRCSVHPSECSSLLLCTPLAGCFCAPGYTGKTCEEKCTSGTYGNNCTQTCGHCRESACNIYTGKCSACLPGYQRPLCKIKYDYTLLAPEVNITSFGEVTVIPVPQDMLFTLNSNPLFYTIQYKKQIGHEAWSSFNTYPLSQKRSDIVIRGLEHGMPYLVRTVLIDADLNSYQGEDIPKANFVSLCTIPENPEYHLEVITNQSSFTVSWKYILENAYWCPVEKFEISWTGGWNWISDFTKITSYSVSNLLPATAFKFKVRAITYRGSAPFSPVTEFSTKFTVLEEVQNLRAVTTSKSAVISWSPPLGLKTVPLTYIVNYKCLEQVACQKQCAVSCGELRTPNTSMSLEFLYPLSQYFVTVSAEDGPTSSIIFGTKMTAPVEVPNPSSTPPVRTNTSVTVYWNKTEVCSGFFSNYVCQIYKVGDTQLLQTGSTQNTNATFGNLQVSTSYRVLVYIQTSFDDINYDKYLEINVSTSATVPDQIQNLTVYKRGRHLLGLRWASPVNSYGPIVSFTVKYGHGETNLYKTEKIKPTQCVVWPHLFCHTITQLQADRTYTISVSARNSEVDADGMLAVTQAITKEKTPGPPEGVKLLNSTSSSFAIQWDYPWLANGIVRSFLMSIEETERFDEQQCCQDFPISETTVNEELEHYTTEISGLHAASTYVVSVTAKTVVFGPSQAMTIHTRPPSLPIVHLPQVYVQANDSLTWQPQRPDFVNNSDVYKPLIKGSLILVVSNDTKFDSTGIHNDKLNEELRSGVGGNFYITAEYTKETEIQLGTNEIVDSKWGEIHNMALQVNTTYQLAVVQISEYCGVYNFDVVWSEPFVAS